MNVEVFIAIFAGFIIVVVILVLCFAASLNSKRYKYRNGAAHENFVKMTLAKSPCPLHGMTEVCLTAIHNDFPSFDYLMYRNKVQSLLLSYFTAVSSKNISVLVGECSLPLKNSVQGIIYDLNSRDVTQFFNDVVIHDIQIARYIKDGKTATVVFEISVEYFSYIIYRNGTVVAGDKDMKVQTVYEVELVYVQDVERLASNGEMIVTNCPNCGAPIKNLSEKSCKFCGTAFIEKNIRTWKFNSVSEQPLQRRQV